MKRRDASTADVMRRLLDGTRNEFWRFHPPSDSLVLADALEQHGHPRLARELARFMTSPGKRGKSVSEVQRIWLALEKDIKKAIDKVAKDRSESSVKYTPARPVDLICGEHVGFLYGFHRISDQEATRLAREVGKRLTYLEGRFVDVILPDGREAELHRIGLYPTELEKFRSTSRGRRSTRGWTWAVMLKR